MRKAVGLIITLWGISIFFNASLSAFDAAFSETMRTVQTAAIIAQEEMVHP